MFCRFFLPFFFTFFDFSPLLLPAWAAAAAAGPASGEFVPLNKEEIEKDTSFRAIKENKNEECNTRKGDWVHTTLRVYGQLGSKSVIFRRFFPYWIHFIQLFKLNAN